MRLIHYIFAILLLSVAVYTALPVYEGEFAWFYALLSYVFYFMGNNWDDPKESN